MRLARCFRTVLLVFIIVSFMRLYALSQENGQIQYNDGTYEASNSILDVAVTIKEGRVVDIKILEHRGGGEEYKQMAESLIDTIIQKQSTQVDAITGATVSSNALKDAIDQALKKAIQQ